MRYKDLTAVGHMDREEMSNGAGGGVVEGKAQPRNCWGAANVAAAQPRGQAHDPELLEGQEVLGVTNIGQQIQAVGGLQIWKEQTCGCG